MDMRMKAVFAGLMAFGLTGCLVSETPVLDAKNGKAKPLANGAYRACPVSDDPEEAEDCEIYVVSYGADGAYTLAMEEEDETVVLRFRKIGRGGYAVQSNEDEGYAYYYGAVAKGVLDLTLMNCPDLPAGLRARLIDRGDLSVDSEDDFTVCTVNTVRGLTDAAKAYHSGAVASDEPALMRMTPAPKE